MEKKKESRSPIEGYFVISILIGLVAAFVRLIKLVGNFVIQITKD